MRGPGSALALHPPPAGAQSGDRSTPGAAPLNLNRIYILPTRHGWLYGLLLAVMLVGSINYNNSLGYMLTFLLASLGLVTMLHSWRNLLGLRIAGGRAMPVFAGDTAHFRIVLDNRDGPARPALRLGPAAPRRRRTRRADHTVISDLQAGAMDGVTLTRIAPRRGRLALGRVRIASRFPLGLFEAWSVLDPALDCLVYPAPAGTPVLPQASALDAEGHAGSRHGSDDFAGFADYRVGDSPRYIAWKALAREQGLLVKRFAGGGSGSLWLRWEQTAWLAAPEARLGQLTRWVLCAAGQGLSYGLALPGLEIPPDSGADHRDRCLACLALHGREP